MGTVWVQVWQVWVQGQVLRVSPCRFQVRTQQHLTTSSHLLWGTRTSSPGDPPVLSLPQLQGTVLLQSQHGPLPAPVHCCWPGARLLATPTALHGLVSKPELQLPQAALLFHQRCLQLQDLGGLLLLKLPHLYLSKLELVNDGLFLQLGPFPQLQEQERQLLFSFSFLVLTQHCPLCFLVSKFLLQRLMPLLCFLQLLQVTFNQTELCLQRSSFISREGTKATGTSSNNAKLPLTTANVHVAGATQPGDS